MNVQRITRALRHVSRLPEVATCLRAMNTGVDIAASYVGLSRLELPRRVRFRNGLVYRLEEYYDLETLCQIHFHRVYPLKPTDAVIVDAGANVGLFSCWAASSNPHSTVVAVEPSPRNLIRLREHVRENRLDSRVTVLPVALAATVEAVWLSECASASQMHHVVDSAMPGTISVPAITLAELWSRIPFPRVDFLKMDIEGSEWDVLLAATPDDLAFVRHISLEYHEPPAGSGHTKAELLRHLARCGFTRIVDCHPGAAFGMLHAERA